MSASRLWYRFGALVAWTFEQRHGRDALVATIAEPAPFFSTAGELLLAAGAEPPTGW